MISRLTRRHHLNRPQSTLLFLVHSKVLFIIIITILVLILVLVIVIVLVPLEIRIVSSIRLVVPVAVLMLVLDLAVILIHALPPPPQLPTNPAFVIIHIVTEVALPPAVLTEALHVVLIMAVVGSHVAGVHVAAWSPQLAGSLVSC